MLSRISDVAGAITLSLFLSTAASAQGALKTPTPGSSSSGVGKQVTSPKDVDKGQNMILPSAGSSGQSAAPTMVYDCQKRPQDCTVPATPADKAGASETNPIKP